MQQLFALALHHLGNGDTCPAAYYLGDIIGGNLFANQRVIALGIGQLTLDMCNVVLKCFQFRVAYFGYLAVVALALGTFCLQLQVLNILLVLLDFVDELALAFPLGTELGFLLLQFGDVLIQLCYLLGVALSFDSLTLDFELSQSAGNLIQLLRYRVALHAQFCCGLVHQVDGLVGEESFRDIAL